MKLVCSQCGHALADESRDSENPVFCPECGFKQNLLDVLTVSVDRKRQESSGLDFSVADEFIEDKLQVGDQIAHFRLVRELGRGGFGTVYEAHDARLERSVALKIPNQSHLSQRQAKVFQREARLAAQLNDPNIVSVFEVGRDGHRLFIVSEFIRGMTLGQWAKKQPRSEMEIAAIMRTIASSMHRAHVASIVHRDLKPGNVLVDEEGRPHITDFGLAKRVSGEDFTLASNGRLVGTILYMSPEQADGSAGSADSRTDVYALGVMMYELLAGRRPFGGSSNQVLTDIRSGSTTPIRALKPSVSRDAEAICMKAMEIDRDRRYHSAAALAEDLQRLIEGRPVSARKAGLATQLRYLIRRNRWAVVGLGLVVVAMAFVLYVFQATAPSTEQGSRVGQAVAAIDEQFLFAEIQVSPEGSQFDVFQVSDNQLRIPELDHLVGPAEPVQVDDHDKVFFLKTGLNLFRGSSPHGEFEFYRYVGSEKNDHILRSTKLYQSTRDSESGHTILEPYQAQRAIPFQDGTWRLGPETMRMIQGGEIAVDLNQVRFFSGRRSLYFPKQQEAVASFLIGETEVTAMNFRRITGRFPLGMRLGADQSVEENVVATHVTWDEAVEYCEKVGGRLPTYVEYLYVATNRGSTEFPFRQPYETGPWLFGARREPAYDKNDDGVCNLYSSVGEWLWEVRLSGPTLYAPGSTAWKHERMFVGLPELKSGSLAYQRTAASDSRDDPAMFQVAGREEQRANVGFRVVKPMPSSTNPAN